MKKLLGFALLLMFAFKLQAQQTVEYGGLTWYTDYNQAKAVAKQENKPIVILFTGSDWCPPCKALRAEVLPNKIFRDLAENVVLVIADFPRRKPMSQAQKQKNRLLAAKFLGRNGLPTMVAVDWRTDTVLNHITGYNFYRHDINPHIQFLKAVIKKFRENG